MKLKIFVLFILIVYTVELNQSVSLCINKFPVLFVFKNNFYMNTVKIYLSDTLLFDKKLTTNESTTYTFEDHSNNFISYDSIVNSNFEERKKIFKIMHEDENNNTDEIIKCNLYLSVGDTLLFVIDNYNQKFVILDSTKYYIVNCEYINNKFSKLNIK